jgi:hypothetical protein
MRTIVGVVLRRKPRKSEDDNECTKHSAIRIAFSQLKMPALDPLVPEVRLV